jgi:hypothetical protein
MYGAFSINNGLTQGDALTSLLFILLLMGVVVVLVVVVLVVVTVVDRISTFWHWR